jgi:hypothetical protein
MKRLISVIQNNFGKMLLLAITAGFMTSCNSVLDFDEGDCSYQYHVKFKYDYNMKYADAFHSLVSTVTLYAFDENGNLVDQTTDAGDQLKDENYSMTLNLAPGTYKFITWAGLNNQSFAVPLLMKGTSKLSDLTVQTRRTDNVVDQNLISLWHGEMDKAVVLADVHSRARDTILTVPLIKNTNTIRIVIVQAADKSTITATRAINKNTFKYALNDNNGWMNYDNTLLTDNMLTYKPYLLADSTISTRTDNATSQAIKQLTGRAEVDTYSAAVAEISTARLLTTQNPQLSITTQDGSISLLPSNSLKQYLYLLKEQQYASMDFQEYLDREDHFDMIFFVDNNLNMLKSCIVVNDWIVWLQDIHL